jgi:hypothetical protein
LACLSLSLITIFSNPKKMQYIRPKRRRSSTGLHDIIIPEVPTLYITLVLVQNQRGEEGVTSRKHWCIAAFCCFSVHDVDTNLPLLAGARAIMGPHTGPHAAAAAAAATVTSLPPLQPRAATTGSTDLLFPLQVQYVCKHS